MRSESSLKRSVVFVLTTSDREEDRGSACDGFVAGYFVKGRTGRGFTELFEMLARYWQLVTLPA